MSLSHLISIRDLTREEAILILDTAEQMAATQGHGVKKLPTLQGKTVVNLFFEDSTRTRISFETAAKRLSADVINFQSRGSSVSKGESLKDTAQTIMAPHSRWRPWARTRSSCATPRRAPLTVSRTPAG